MVGAQLERQVSLPGQQYGSESYQHLLEGDIGTRVWGLGTWGRETIDLGTSSMGRRDVWDRDAGRKIQGCGAVKYRDEGDVNDYYKSRR